MADLFLNSALTHSLLLIVPIAAALLLRWARCPGWSVLGGVGAGLLIGASIFGRVVPDTFEAHFVGGVEERIALDELRARQGADVLAAGYAQSDPEIFEALRDRHAKELVPVTEAHRAAQWTFQRPLRSYTGAVALLVLLAGGLLRVPGDDRCGGLTVPLSMGAWSALVPGGIATAVFGSVLGFSWDTAMLVGAGVAIGPWVLTAVDRVAADRAEQGGAHRVQLAGRVASVLALGAVTAVVVGSDAWYWWLPMMALPVGWMLPAAGASRRWLMGVTEVALIPSLAACASLRVDLMDAASFWPIMLVVLLSGDGRMCGATLGAVVPGGRTAMRTMRLVLGCMAAAPTQLAVTAIAMHTWMIGDRAGVALVAGAVVIAVTVPLRKSLAEGTEALGH